MRLDALLSYEIGRGCPLLGISAAGVSKLHREGSADTAAAEPLLDRLQQLSPDWVRNVPGEVLGTGRRGRGLPGGVYCGRAQAVAFGLAVALPPSGAALWRGCGQRAGGGLISGIGRGYCWRGRYWRSEGCAGWRMSGSCCWRRGRPFVLGHRCGGGPDGPPGAGPQFRAPIVNGVVAGRPVMCTLVKS